MTNFNLSVNLDYEQRKIKPNLMAMQSNFTGFTLNSATFRLYDDNGVIFSQGGLYINSGSIASTIFSSTIDFGLDLGPVYNGGYDSSISRTDLSGVYCSRSETMWEMNAEVPILSATVRTYELDLAGNNIYHILDRRNNIYIDTPLTIIDGDAVLQGTVATVANKNQITITSDKLLAAYSGYNLSKSFVRVISGAASGQTFSITSQSSNTLYADKDCTSLSGQLVKIMPRREVSSYSGLTYYGTGSNRGAGGMQARLGLSENIPATVGSLSYASGYYSGTTFVNHPLIPGYVEATLGTDGYVAGVVALRADTYQRTVKLGDVLLYNPASSPSSTYTGVILEVGSHANTGQGDYHIKYWPGVAASTGSTYKIHRTNRVVLDLFPNFSTEYTAVATNQFGEAGSWYANVTTPSASIDFTANEQESTYGTVTETSHFFLGPITLSNGQVIKDVITGSMTPALWFSGTVSHGDPSSPSAVVTKTAFSTQNPNVGDQFNGMYSSNGVLTYAATTSFIAAEVLTANSVVKFGSAKIANVSTIPVQPTI